MIRNKVYKKRKIVIIIWLPIVIFSLLLYLYSHPNMDNSLQTKETKHFKIQYEKKDEKCISDIVKNLENNYNRITTNLMCDLKKKVNVEIYPNIESFHDEINMPNANEGLVGVAINNKIKMVSPLNPGNIHNYNSLMLVVQHEFTHIVVSEICPDISNLPIWLSEGTATFESNQISEKSKQALKVLISQKKIPKIDDMNVDNFSEIGGYLFSYTIVEFIINKYGYDNLLKLIKEPLSYQSIFGVSKSEFESLWISYLVDRYE